AEGLALVTEPPCELLTTPTTVATPTAAASPAKATAGTSRRGFGWIRRGGGGGASASTRSRSSVDTTGRLARSSWTSSSCDTGTHLLFELLQGAAQARRACARADPEHACGAVAVEVEDDPQREDFPLGRRETRQSRLELRGEALAECRVLRIRAAQRVAPFAAAAALFRAKVIQSGRARQLAEPRARRAAARVELAPALERSGEGLGCQVFGHVAVSGQVDEERVHVVQVALGRLREVLRVRLHDGYT